MATSSTTTTPPAIRSTGSTIGESSFRGITTAITTIAPTTGRIASGTEDGIDTTGGVTGDIAAQLAALLHLHAITGDTSQPGPIDGGTGFASATSVRTAASTAGETPDIPPAEAHVTIVAEKCGKSADSVETSVETSAENAAADTAANMP